MTTYDALTPQQREQVTDLFCDSAFETDPTQYVYALTGDVVAWRKAITAANITPRKPRRVSVTTYVMDTPRVTPEQVHSMERVYQAIARRIIARSIVSSVEA